MQLQMQGGSYYMDVHMLSGSGTNVRDENRNFPLASIAAMRGHWTDIMLHFDTSGGRQSLEAFVNGRSRAHIRNWIGFRPKEYYFKYGIYRSFVSRNGSPMPTQVLYVDEVRMGPSRASVDIASNPPVD
jgi:hypothetical protein